MLSLAGISREISAMLHTRRSALTAATAVVAACALAPWPAQAQGHYPSQTIRFIIPAGAGGLPDTVARIVGKRLQEKVGQSVVVENRAGGNGAVSVGALMASPPDGYAFIVQDGSIYAINPHIYANMPYKVDDLLPVVMIAKAPLFLAVHQKVPVTNMREFIAYVKANPGKLNYGSSGIGSTHHLSMEALKAALGLEMTHVPFRGTSESVPALLGGHVDAAFAAYPNLAAAVGTGNVRMLATNGAQRSPNAPDVPPVADFIPGYEFAPIVGIYARAGTPDSVVQKIAGEVIALAKEPEIVKALATAGIDAAGQGPQEYRAALKRESERVAATVKAAGLKPQ
jgi:tripartite-type tricarboxylate transporter receptor subunit TctC